MDIPEFYQMSRELFTEDEAAVTNVMPRGFNPAPVIADAIGKSEEDIVPILEKMAEKGLCIARKEEALEILQNSEEAGLIHCSTNRQEIDWLCKCCSCHLSFLILL